MLNKLLCLICFLCVVCFVFAQENTALSGFVKNEKAFAANAVETQTKQAFLEYLDSAGVVFNKGKIENGIQFWSKQPASGGKLLWHPVYAAVAASGEIGFTTGPWIFKKTLNNDTVLASGFYSTIWHLTADSQWKFIADLGIDCGSQPFKDTGIRLPTSVDRSVKTATTIKFVEEGFITDYTNREMRRLRKLLIWIHGLI